MKKNIFCLGLLSLSTSYFAQTADKDSLQNKEKKIDEVVITSSYGTKKLKEELVGSISTISSKDIVTSQAFESIDKMIAGLAPGVQISAGTEVGANVKINIRGLGSLTPLNSNFTGTSTQPLIIIDGIILKEDKPFDATFFNGTDDSEYNINSLARVSTDNIESINILKDAAAVALYGADAANGVILITTKKGKKGKPVFSYTSQYGLSSSINKIKYLNGAQYAKVYDAYLRNNGSNSGFNYNGVDEDWFDIMNKNGDFYKTNLSFSGGVKAFTYRVGLDYSNNNESKVLNKFQKKGIDTSLGFDFGKLKFSLFGSYTNLIKDQPNTFFNFILAPTFAAYNPDGSYHATGYKGIPNPLAAANQNIDHTINNSVLSSINASYDIFKNLKVSSIFAVDYSHQNDVDWRSGLNESGQHSGSFTINGVTYPKNGESRLKKSDALKWNWSAQAYFEKDFAQKNHIDILAGFELRKTNEDKSAFLGTNFVDANTYQLPWQAAQYTTTSGDLVNGYKYLTLTNRDAGRSLFSQVNYDYSKKYFASFTIRRDESSAFGSDKNAAINGGLGVSWNISNENFLKNIAWIDFLRLRTSAGITGNSRIGSYRSAGLYNVYQNGFSYDFDYATPDTSSPPNKELGWEKNVKYDLGIDFNILKKIQFTLDLFRNNISDMIVSRNVPLETGYTSAQINGAAMYNQGIEFSTKVDWFRKKNFSWNSFFNISTVDNKVTDLIGLGDTYSIASRAIAQKIGTSTSAIWGFVWTGVNPANGLDTFLQNGQKVDANKLNTSSDQWQILGNTQPDAFGGLTNNFRFAKRFNLSFQINFEIGGDILINPELLDQYRILLNRNMSVNALDFWSPDNPNAPNHVPKNNAKIVSNSTKYLYNNTNVKLQNINLGYSIPIKKGKEGFIKTADIFCDITNVAYWYKQKSPQDRNGIREFRYLYPEMRTISFGFKMNF